MKVKPKKTTLMLMLEEATGRDVRDVLCDAVSTHRTDDDARMYLAKLIDRHLDRTIISVWGKRLDITHRLAEARELRASLV